MGFERHGWEFTSFIGECNELIGQDLGTGKIIGNDDWLLSQDFDADLIRCKLTVDITIGAGAVVTQDLPPGVTVAGVPASVMAPTGNSSMTIR
jgi:hypothetical protein